VKARPALDAFLDAELDKLRIDESKLALVGFSQGTMMALHTGLRRKRAPGAILGYSGMLVGPEHLGEATARSAKGETPPILLVHGDADQVIPLDALFQASDDLGKANLPCQWHLSLGIGHGIDGAGLQHGGLFLVRNFGLPFPKRV
jgi:phospholipase/carboxylesterase